MNMRTLLRWLALLNGVLALFAGGAGLWLLVTTSNQLHKSGSPQDFAGTSWVGALSVITLVVAITIGVIAIIGWRLGKQTPQPRWRARDTMAFMSTLAAPLVVLLFIASALLH